MDPGAWMQNTKWRVWTLSLFAGISQGCASSPAETGESCALGTVQNTLEDEEAAYARDLAKPAADTDAPIGGLCDGSDDVRLMYTEGGSSGTMLEGVLFAYPYGPMIVVDGHCHYYAMGDYMLGIHEGQLSRDDLDQLTRDLAVDQLDNYPSTRPDDVADCFVEMIATATSSLSCLCHDCGSQAPAEATEAFRRAEACLS